MSTHYDLAVIGTGSGNSLVDERFADRTVAILEKGTFGGTCLNVGLHPHEDVRLPGRPGASAAHGPALGVDTRFDGARWREIRDRIFGRIDPISHGGHDWRASDAQRDVFERHAGSSTYAPSTRAPA